MYSPTQLLSCILNIRRKDSRHTFSNLFFFNLVDWSTKTQGSFPYFFFPEAGSNKLFYLLDPLFGQSEKRKREIHSEELFFPWIKEEKEMPLRLVVPSCKLIRGVHVFPLYLFSCLALLCFLSSLFFCRITLIRFCAWWEDAAMPGSHGGLKVSQCIWMQNADLGFAKFVFLKHKTTSILMIYNFMTLFLSF